MNPTVLGNYRVLRVSKDAPVHDSRKGPSRRSLSLLLSIPARIGKTENWLVMEVL